MARESGRGPRHVRLRTRTADGPGVGRFWGLGRGQPESPFGRPAGQVVLLHFYAFQCHNCHANFDIYQRWHQTLRDQGIEVVGVQTPETDDERDAGKVVAAAKKAGFEFPVLVDLKSANWDAWGTTMWPTVYVIDRRGYVRHWWMGELRWKGAQGDQEIERLAKRLLA